MGLLLRDALRRLCVEIGWSYAVFWRVIGDRNPKQLVWEDGHCERLPSFSGFDAMDMLRVARGCGNGYAEVGSQAEDRLGMFMKMMVSQVHVVGEGVVGRAALTGNHQWIFQDMFGESSSNILAERTAQFFAGIQTIAIIPVLPFGVVQLGSIQMVMENIEFLNHVRYLFAQLGSVPGALLSDVTQKSLSKNSLVPASSAILGFTYPSGEFCSQAVRSLHAISEECSHQPDRSTSFRTVTQPSDSTFVHLNVKSDSGVSKVTTTNMVTAATLVIHSEVLQQIIDPIIKPGHLNSQPACSSSEVQLSQTNPSIGFNQQATDYSSCSGLGDNSLVATSNLSSSSLAVPGRLPLPSSNIGPLENKPTNCNSESLQIRSNRCKSPYQLTSSDIGSFYGRKGQFAGVNAFGETRSFPVDAKVNIKTSHGIPSGNGIYFMTNKIKDLDGQQRISESLMSSHLLKKNSQDMVTAGRNDQGNDLFDVLPAESDKYRLCFNSLGSLADCWTSSSNPSEEKQRFSYAESIVNTQKKVPEEPHYKDSLGGKSSLIQSGSGNDLFDALGIEYKSSHCNAHELDTDVSTCISPLDIGPLFDSLNHEDSCTDIFSENYHDQLLDAVVSKARSGAKQNSDDDASCRTSITNISKSSLHASSSASGWVVSSEQTESNSLGCIPVPLRAEATIYNLRKSACSTDKTEECSMRGGPYKSPIIPWVENGQNIECGIASIAQCKQADDIGKLTRKRSRPGESPRPRPQRSADDTGPCERTA
ncbi:hypothetical protein J5N97_012144 [Dioscorea zingiberensis]|uniref:Transcription factor MYC/MYB N-terminal domain-containing protein n=1 Tax=Dioscorea zingiberensis TaxID=325984 RepID=A0A9D5CNM2_9LILI|nr:hypothetical protein J5N97_012144 [Dioscorea zingiberensis]